jgi:hypothetical protein
MGTYSNKFYDWAYGGRAATVKRLRAGEEISHDRMFLSFTTHNPAYIRNGSKGLNASIKGIGWLPKKELLPEILAEYVEHIKTYKAGDDSYSKRGLEILYNRLYSDEAAKNIDFDIIGSIEMAFVHTWYNLLENPQTTLLFYQPPAVSFELRGKTEIVGKRYEKTDSVKPSDLELYQQFINAQHDVYHAPNIDRWKTRPVYIFRVEEIWNNSTGPDGFGKRIL